MTLISRPTACVKGQESRIILQKSVPKLPPGMLDSNMFKQNSAREKPEEPSLAEHTLRFVPTSSCEQPFPAQSSFGSHRTGYFTDVRNLLPQTGFVCQISVKAARNSSPFLGLLSAADNWGQRSGGGNVGSEDVGSTFLLLTSCTTSGRSFHASG